MYQEPDDILRDLIKKDIDITAKRNIATAMKKWGIEITEQKIKEVYIHCPKLKEIMLKNYREIINEYLSR